MGSFLACLGWRCAAHPFRVVGGWAVVVAVACGLAVAFGGQPRGDCNAHNAIGADFLATTFPDAAGATARVVIVGTAARRIDAADLTAVRRRLEAVPGVSGVSQRLAGTSALLTVQYRVPVTAFHGPDGLDGLRRAIAPAQRSGLRIELGGEVPENYTADGGKLERNAVLAAGGLLLVASGSIAAAAVAPSVVAFGAGTGLAIVLILAGFAPTMSATAPVIGTALGVGIGIGYSMLYLSRFREYLSARSDPREAAAAANGSAGTAIVLAGATLLVALLGFQLAGIPQYATYAYPMVANIVAVTAAAVTLAPALCGLGGHRIVRWRPVRRAAKPAPTPAWVYSVTRRPAAWATAALVVLLVLGAPVLGMRTWPRDPGSLSTSDTVRRAHDVVAAEFGPGANGPFIVGVDTSRVSARQLDDTRAALREIAGVAGVFPVVYNTEGSAAVFTVEPVSAPRDDATAQTLRQVRAQLPPGMHLSGLTAYFVGVSDLLAQRLWLLIIAVVGLGALVLSIVHKAPGIAITTALMKLLTLAATYGVLVAIFQWGWGASLFGLPGAVPLSSWSAILLLVIVFGLSTDYEVFIVSRIAEQHLVPGDAVSGVRRGFAAVAPAVVTAATVIAAAFAAFILDPDLIVKMMCVGVVVGLLVDVIVVRLVLLPATMTLLSRSAQPPGQ